MDNQQLYENLLELNDYLEKDEVSHMSHESFKVENDVIFYENTLV